MRLIPATLSTHSYPGGTHRLRTLLISASLLMLPLALQGQVLSYAGAQTALASYSGVTAPLALTVDSAGTRYIVNVNGTSVTEITAAGVQSTCPVTSLTHPVAIAVDSTGNLFIADSSNNHLLEVFPNCGASQTVGGTANHPNGVAVDSAGNVYLPDTANHGIAKVAAGSRVNQTSIGAGQFTTPSAIAIDQNNNLFVLDNGAHAIDEVTITGSTVTVTPVLTGLTYSPTSLAVDRTGNIYLGAASGQHNVTMYQVPAQLGSGGTIRQLGHSLSSPVGLAFDNTGKLNVADQTAPAIDIIEPGFIELGSANLCPTSGTQTAPCSESATLYFNVASGQTVTAVTASVLTQGHANQDFTATSNTCTGALTGPATCSITATFAPLAPGSRLGAVDVSGIVAPASTSALLDTIPLYGLGVAGQAGFDAGQINSLPLTLQSGSALSAAIPDGLGNLYFIDNHACTVNKFTVSNSTTTLVAGTTCGAPNSGAGSGGPAASATFVDPWRLALNGRGDLYIADDGAAVIWKVDAVTGIITTAAGTLNSRGYSADGTIAATSQLNHPFALAVSGDGDLYFADWGDEIVRKIDADSGVLITVAGNYLSGAGYTGDGGAATAAQLSFPIALAIDPSGNLYIADNHNTVIRKVTLFTGNISTVAGMYMTPGFTGDGAAATNAELSDPEGLATDAAGNLYIADSGNFVVRKVSASNGFISTVAGTYTGTAQNTGEGGAANLAGLGYVQDVSTDSSGNLYVIDSTNSLIRQITAASGVVSFATYTMGTSSPAIDVVVSNTGNSALDLSALSTATNFNVGGADTNCSGTTTLATGESCVLGVEFLPTAAGTLTGSLTLTDDAGNFPGATQTLALSGTGAYVPTQLVLSTIPATETTGSNLGVIQASIESSGGNVVTNSTASVTATLTGPGGYSQTVSASAVSGFASLDLSNFSLSPAGIYQVTVSSSGLTSANSTINVVNPPATQLVLGSLPATSPASAMTGPVTVSVEAANGSTVTTSETASVTLTITGPGNYSLVQTTVAASGVATFTLSSSSFTATGAYTLTATSPGLTSSSATVTIVPPPATQVILSSLPASVTAGGNLGTATASIEDASASVVTSSSAPITLSITGPGSYSQTSTVAAAGGVATFNLASFALTSTGTYTVTASSTGLTSGSTIVTVVPQPATQLALGGLPTTIVAGDNLGTATASIESANGAVVTTTSAAVTLSITGPGNYTQTLTVSARSGVATFALSSLALTSAGTYTVTATSTGLTPATAMVDVTVVPAFTLTTSGSSGASTQTVAAGAAATYTFSLGATNLISPQTFTFTATGLPSGATATFSPATLTLSTAAASTTLTIQTSAATAALRNPGSFGGTLGGLAMALLLLPLAGSRRLRRAAGQLPMLGIMLGLVALGAVCGLAGCGGGSSTTSTPTPQTYTVKVTGTSGSNTVSTTVTLIVQ